MESPAPSYTFFKQTCRDRLVPWLSNVPSSLRSNGQDYRVQHARAMFHRGDNDVMHYSYDKGKWYRMRGDTKPMKPIEVADEMCKLMVMAYSPTGSARKRGTPAETPAPDGRTHGPFTFDMELRVDLGNPEVETVVGAEISDGKPGVYAPEPLKENPSMMSRLLRWYRDPEEVVQMQLGWVWDKNESNLCFFTRPFIDHL